MKRARLAAEAGSQEGNGAPPAARPSPMPGADRPARARRGRRGRRAALSALLLVVIAGGAVWAVLGSSLLVVRQVEVSGNHLVPSARILAAAKIRTGAPLATVNTGAAARRVERIAAILSARVSRSWPDAIVITVTERTPQLAVATVGGYQLIDPDGVTVRFSAREPDGLPVFTSPPAVLRGSPAVRAAAAVLAGLPPGLRARIVSVSAPAGAVTLRLRGGITVVWGGPGDGHRKAAELAVLLRTHARHFDVSDPNTVVTKR